MQISLHNFLEHNNIVSRGAKDEKYEWTIIVPTKQWLQLPQSVEGGPVRGLVQYRAFWGLGEGWMNPQSVYEGVGFPGTT